MKVSGLKIICGVFLALSGMNAAFGSIIIDTLNNSPAGSYELSGGSVGMEFTMPSGGGSLSSVTLNLSGSGKVNVWLYSAGSGGPGSSIAAIGAQTVTGSMNYTFSYNGDATLAANTSYYIVAISSSSVTWTYSSSSENSGSGTIGTVEQGGTATTGETPLMEVNAVPEPSTFGYGLGALSLVAVGLIKRFRPLKTIKEI